MESSLFANDVITANEKTIIEHEVGHKKMEYLIVKIIIPSLKKGFGKKYKSFLKSMEKNEDVDLQAMAKQLGKFGCVFIISN